MVDAVVHNEPSPVPVEDSIANVRLLERLFAAAGIELPPG